MSEKVFITSVEWKHPYCEFGEDVDLVDSFGNIMGNVFYDPDENNTIGRVCEHKIWDNHEEEEIFNKRGNKKKKAMKAVERYFNIRDKSAKDLVK